MCLHIIRNGILMVLNYTDEVVRLHVVIYVAAIDDVLCPSVIMPDRIELENILKVETIQYMK